MGHALSDESLLAQYGLRPASAGELALAQLAPRVRTEGVMPLQEGALADEARIVWRCLPGPQARFLACPAFTVLFGGAAGGGKSDVGMAWLMEPVWHPEYVAVYFRRTYPDMVQMRTRMQAIYGAFGAAWRDKDGCFAFPSGARIFLRHLQREADIDAYGSQSFVRVFFDELTTFTAAQWRFFYARLRTAADALRPYLGIRGATNPRGPGLPWVRGLFLGTRSKPLLPGTIYRHHATDGEGNPTTITRCFIPSKLKDNPFINTPEYRASMSQLAEADRRALEDGDWWAYEGEVFNLKAGFSVLSLAQASKIWGGPQPPRHWPRYRFMDWGFARPFAVLWVAVDGWGRGWVYREWYGAQTNESGEVLPDVGSRMPPETAARGILAREEGDTITRAWAGPDLWHDQDGDDAKPLGEGQPVKQDAESKAARMADLGCHFTPWLATNGSRRHKRALLAAALEHGPRAERGLGERLPLAAMVLTEELCPELLRTLPALVPDPVDPEAVSKACEDHLYDALSAACVMRVLGPQAAPQELGRQAQLELGVLGSLTGDSQIPWEVR